MEKRSQNKSISKLPPSPPSVHLKNSSPYSLRYIAQVSNEVDLHAVSFPAPVEERFLLSAVVITLNSAATLKRCLESLSFADEVIVLDGGSTDQTQVVARECGARLLENSYWQGFCVQKNRALDLASHEWILLLDSDEWLEASAAQEIRDVVVSSGNANLNDSRNAAAGSVPQATTAPQAYRLRRRSRYLGRIVRHSGWWPDHVTRLFRRNAARYSEDWVH